MDRAKLIPNGGSQAVRLPKEYRFEGDEVGIGKVGDVVVLIPEDKTSYETMRMAVDMFLSRGPLRIAALFRFRESATWGFSDGKPEKASYSSVRALSPGARTSSSANVRIIPRTARIKRTMHE